MKTTITFAGLGLLSALCLASLLAGCGMFVRSGSEGDCGSGAACAPAANTSTTNSESSKPPPQTREDIGPNGPPDSTLTYGQRVIVGQPGSFCWMSSGNGGCADAALTVPERTLRVPMGEELRFAYGGQLATEMRGTSYPITQNDRVDYPDGARPLKRVESQNKASIPVDLTPGEYLLEVFVRVPQGDASYYFHLLVRPGETEDTRDNAAPATSPSQGVVAAPPPGATTVVPDNGSLYSGAYEVTKDGDLIYGGDIVVRCEDLVKMGAPARPGSEDVTFNGSVMEPLTREAVEFCAEAGFNPEGATLRTPEE